MADFDIIELRSDQPFDLDRTLSCGQAPRWYREDGWWYGIFRKSPIKIKQEDNQLFFSGVNADIISEYFCLDLDLNRVYEKLNSDIYGKKAVENNYGLRILNQDAWECMVFQMTVNKIRTKASSDRITRISSRLGKKINFDGKDFYAFPEASEIVSAGLPALKSCNIGYFADNIMLAANRVSKNPLWENEIASASYDDAVSILSDFKGVKHRVAEWILLLAFKRYEAFPVDAHIRKFFMENYLKGRFFGTSKDEKYDETIRDIANRNFGEYKGYALEYLFCMDEFSKTDILQ